MMNAFSEDIDAIRGHIHSSNIAKKRLHHTSGISVGVVSDMRRPAIRECEAVKNCINEVHTRRFMIYGGSMIDR